MLFGKEHWRGLADGSITVAFRRWIRPTVRPGGTLTTPSGVLAIEDVVEVSEEDLDDADARASGYPSVAQLRDSLRAGEDRRLYRITFQHVGADPREELRTRTVDEAGLREVERRLDRLDAASETGPWTRLLLAAIDRHPGMWSGDLAAEVGDERDRLKRRVRRLKELGLTESLRTGYRISPRGRSVLERLGEAERSTET